MGIDGLLSRIEKVTGFDRIPDQLLILSKLTKGSSVEEFEQEAKDKQAWQRSVKEYYDSFASSRIYKFACKELLDTENIDTLVQSRKDTVKYQKAPDAFYVTDFYLSMARLHNISSSESDEKYWDLYSTLISLGENYCTALMATSALLKKCGLPDDRKLFLAHILSKMRNSNGDLQLTPSEELRPIVSDYLEGKVSMTEAIGLIPNQATEVIHKKGGEVRETVRKKHEEKKKEGKTKIPLNPAKLLHGWALAVIVVVINVVLWNFKLGTFMKFLHVLAIMSAIASIVYEKILKNRTLGMLLLLVSILLTAFVIAAMVKGIFKFLNSTIVKFTKGIFGGWGWIVSNLKKGIFQWKIPKF